MKRILALIITVILCITCSVSLAERKTVVKDQYYLGAMRVVRCKNYVSLREKPDKTSTVLARVPLDSVVLYCSNNLKKYANGKYKKQYSTFIRCEYEGIEGYILAKYLVPAPECEPVETKQNNKLMTREQIIGKGEVILDWKEFNVSVLAAYEVRTENNEEWEYVRVGCFINDEPNWGYTEGVRKTGKKRSLRAFMGGTEDEPQVYVYDAQYALIMLDLMDGDEGWMLMKGNCELGDAAVMSISKETGIMYIAGSKGPDPVAISPEGNILWRAEINDPEVSGPKKISLKKDNIKVTYKSGKTVLLEYSGELISISDSV